MSSVSETKPPILHSSLFRQDLSDEEPIFESDYKRHFNAYLKGGTDLPLFLCGDSLKVLADLPADSIDCCITSPPYWNKREYEGGGIGLEETYMEFIRAFLLIAEQVKRVLKPTGSFWLNVGDSYSNKQLLSIPWRIAIAMTDQQGWILRNSVIWNKVKGGPDNAKDKLRNIYEPVFHFVKSGRYYFNDNAIRKSPAKSKIVNGSVVSATGVSGIRYRRQIELTTSLDEKEKSNAIAALQNILNQMAEGKVSDFRMIIRNQQRTTHSDSQKLSGRAKQLRDQGFYFLKYHPNGSKPSDVWDILPEDTQKRESHFAPFPEDLCKIPLVATCPPDGIALDPFCGTGTTMLAALRLRRKSVGIDISRLYLESGNKRCLNTIL